MKIYYSENNNFILYKPLEKITLCLGFFDGLHLGHIHLIKQALKENDNVYLMTFSSDIKSSIKNTKSKGLLTSIEDKKEILEKLGVKGIFVINFNLDVMNTSYLDFISLYLKPLNIKNIYVGSDFRFGKDGKGNIDILKEYFLVKIVDFYMVNNEKVSSKDIISSILQGDILLANKLLGRDYSIKGKVVHGLQNGTKIGFPTANIECSFNYVIPKNGVYATKIIVNHEEYLSMTNIGTHPTIDELLKPSIECNIFNFVSDIYEKEVKLFFLGKIRDEVKFKSLKELIEQLKKDRKAIEEKYK